MIWKKKKKAVTADKAAVSFKDFNALKKENAELSKKVDSLASDNANLNASVLELMEVAGGNA